MGYGISNSKVLAECNRKADTVRFLRCPRKLKATRGHNPDNKYAKWRNPLRDARRKFGKISGRQWVKFRKYGQKAYRQYVKTQTDRGMNENPNTT